MNKESICKGIIGLSLYVTLMILLVLCVKFIPFATVLSATVVGIVFISIGAVEICKTLTDKIVEFLKGE